jgi:hypothetical protein
MMNLHHLLVAFQIEENLQQFQHFSFYGTCTSLAHQTMFLWLETNKVTFNQLILPLILQLLQN